MAFKMSLLRYALLLTAALCCTAAPASDDSCPRPDRLTEAELLGDWENSSYPQNTEAVYQCRPGYTRLGLIKLVCLKGKWQYISRGQCKQKRCGHPGDIKFGSFELIKEESFVFGAVVEFSCDEGYQMVSKERTRQCTANGWSNYPPHCEARNCPPVDAAANIKVLSTSYDEEYSVGQVVRFECKDPNLKLNGASEVFCTSEGEWNMEPPTCIEISCRPPQVDNGRLNNPRKSVYKNDEVIQITCNEGFVTIKNGETKCTKDEWIPKPACNEIVCSPYHPVEKGRMISTQTIYKYGDEIDVQCDRGYVLQVEPNKRRKCTSNGWSPSVRCVSKKCDRPHINHGSARWAYYPLDIGRYVYYDCDYGFMTPDKYNGNYITCTEGGWNHEPRCLRRCVDFEDSLENANILNRQSIYLEGENVNFQCYTNYKTSDGNNYGQITCLPNGKFTSAKCSIKCNAPQVQNGKFNPNKNEFEFGEYLQYQCNKGYMTREKKLSGRTQCLQAGWSGTPGCIAITCKYKKDVYKDGDIVTYSCPHGKRPISDIAQCYHFGFSPPAICQDIVCTIPDTSDLILSPRYRSYPFNRKVSFSCRDGFYRDGASESSCLEEGWNPPLPTCKDTNIATENPPIKKDIVCTIPDTSDLILSPRYRSYALNRKVSFSCRDGFYRDGASESSCLEEGWNPPLPTCKEVEPTKPGQTTDDNKKQEVEPTKPGQTTNDNKKQVGNPSVAPTQTADSKDETEKKQRCALAHTPPNAEIIDPKEAYYSNDKVTVKCSYGYKIYGSSTIQCIEGKWDQPPECIRLMQCNAPPTIKNGNILESSKQEIYVNYDVVQYTCKSGFHFSWSDESTCLNEQWTTPPKCTEDSCDEAPEVTDATTEDKKKTFDHGEKAKYICKNGFRLSGQDAANCVEGKWLNIPTCVATSCETPPTVPNAILNGRSKASYASGEKVTYSCSRGYSLERSLTGEALCENTQWLDVPVCRKIGEPCGPPPTVQFGDTAEIRKANYRSNDFVEYRCPDYYVLKGAKFVRCLNGVWGEAPVCLEPCTASEKAMEENHIQLRYLSDKKLYSKHNDEMEFSCKENYEALPDTQMRTACKEGKLQFPKCFKRGFCVLQQGTMITNNIHYNTSNVVDPGQITFQCNEGMIPENKLEAKCERGNINYPKCTSRKSCKTPKILNGLLKTGQQNSYDSGSSVTFECNENYVINGPINAKCQNGEWIDLPVCHRPCKISSEDLTKSNIQLLSSDDQKNNLDTNYKHGTELSATCKPGFKRPNQSVLVIECYDGKFRFPRCFSGKTCRLDQDGLDHNNLELHEVHENESFYTEDEKIQFKCKSGFHHLGQPTGTCSDQKLSYPICAASSSV